MTAFGKFKSKRRHVASLLKRGDPVNVIHRQTGICKDYIRKVRDEEGIAVISHGYGSAIKDFSQIDKMLMAGKTDQNIARQLGHQNETVATRRKKLGIPRSNIVPQSTKDNIVHLSEQPELLSIRRIARITGVDSQTVKKVIEQSVKVTPRSDDDQEIQTVEGVRVDSPKARAVQNK